MLDIRPRVVLDTNILVSALLFGGKPGQIFRKVIDKSIVGISSPPLVTELTGVLRKKFGFSLNRTLAIERKIRKNFVMVLPRREIKLLRDDPDNRVLEAAQEGNADMIVTGDNHLLALKTFRGITIITPHYFLDKVYR